MSIYKRINEAREYVERGDPEAALTPLMNAVDALAGGGRAKFKKWLASKMPIISNALLDCGPAADAVRLPVRADNPQMQRPDEHGTLPLQEILYHLVRCGLDHACSVDPAIVDNKDSSIRWDDQAGVLYIHLGKLAVGLLLAVVSDLLEQDAERIEGSLNGGYPLKHFCGLEVGDVLIMMRTLGQRRRMRMA